MLLGGAEKEEIGLDGCCMGPPSVELVIHYVISCALMQAGEVEINLDEARGPIKEWILQEPVQREVRAWPALLRLPCPALPVQREVRASLPCCPLFGTCALCSLPPFLLLAMKLWAVAAPCLEGPSAAAPPGAGGMLTPASQLAAGQGGTVELPGRATV